MSEIEDRARKANSPDEWSRLWTNPETRDWRDKAMTPVYDRIVSMIPAGARVVDLGGGVGMLAKRLIAAGCPTEVWEHNDGAIAQLQEQGIPWKRVDLEELDIEYFDCDVVIATEVLEHLSEKARSKILDLAHTRLALFSVPNDRLHPEEEHQHTIDFTAKSLLDILRARWMHCRVEVPHPAFLLGVCGFDKEFTMSVCFPAKDEAADIERTLCSFRGVADQLVVGVDPRSTDNTWEICEKYCDLVFALEDPHGTGDEKVPEGGVHFAWIRNQCIEKCTGDWIFMTEAHEYLESGQDTLLALSRVMPAQAQVGFTLRRGQGQQWAFPWLFKNGLGMKYKRSTHNILDYPEGTYVVRLPQVITIHARNHQNAVDRKKQRKVQNRKTLYEDWVTNKNENSLYYLASEWREYDEDRAVEYFEQFLAAGSNNGPMRYQARLILGKTLWNNGEHRRAKEVLIRCTEDDWNRIDHWIWLGDIAYDEHKYEESYTYYRYASTMMGNTPFTLWWIDLANYSYLPAQRLAMVCSEIGNYKESLYWAKKAREYLPVDAPAEIVGEHMSNIAMLEEHLGIHQDPE